MPAHSGGNDLMSLANTRINGEAMDFATADNRRLNYGNGLFKGLPVQDGNLSEQFHTRQPACRCQRKS